MGAEAQPEPTLLADVRWLRLLAARLAGAADGDDLAQDTMMVALRRLPPEGEQRRPWLVVTARNLWRRRRRDQGRRRQHDAALETPEPAPTAEAALERLDTLRLVADLVRALPDPYRATVLMRYFEGKSAAESPPPPASPRAPCAGGSRKRSIASGWPWTRAMVASGVAGPCCCCRSGRDRAALPWPAWESGRWSPLPPR